MPKQFVADDVIAIRQGLERLEREAQERVNYVPPPDSPEDESKKPIAEQYSYYRAHLNKKEQEVRDNVKKIEDAEKLKGTIFNPYGYAAALNNSASSNIYLGYTFP